MRGDDRTDFYRSNRDYGNLLDGEEVGDEDEDEYEDERKSPEQGEDPVSQEYFEWREQLKELERQKLRRRNGQSIGRSNNNGNNASEERRSLPYDNYGSFFGPSKPVVARRIIEDARAKEDIELAAARIVREAPEHRSVNGTFSFSRSTSEAETTTEPLEQARPIKEAVVKLQHLKESRDYSFLFTDEDLSTSPKKDAQSSNSRNSDRDRPQQTSPHVTKMGIAAQKGTPLKSSSTTKLNISTQHKAKVVQERQSHPTNKLSKPAGMAPSLKTKPSFNGLNSDKVISGPGRPSQASASMHVAKLMNGKEAVSQSGVQPKKAGTTGRSWNGVQSMKIGQSLPDGSGSSVKPGKSALVSAAHNSAPAGNVERKTASENKQRIPIGNAQQKQVSVGRVDLRRPIQSSKPSKQIIKTARKSVLTGRAHKRPLESESEDSFLVDDDDDGGDVSSTIRKMFGYNPNKYRHLDDEDDRNMEANFRTIQMEEKRSAKIAREEDERELALLEEEERAERLKKEARKRKR